MRIKYIRCSTIEQNSDRQKVDALQYDLIIEDKVSGSVPFHERVGGKRIIDLVKQGVVETVHVHKIDRLGRNLKDILEVIQFMTDNKIAIHFESQGLKTIDENGKENPVTKMIISVLATIAEMNKNQILENQAEGIQIAKAKGKYKGRKQGTQESVLKFLSKSKNKKALDLLSKDYSCTEVSKIVGVHLNTVTKIKRLGLNMK